jgi:hypothetical protein
MVCGVKGEWGLGCLLFLGMHDALQCEGIFALASTPFVAACGSAVWCGSLPGVNIRHIALLRQKLTNPQARDLALVVCACCRTAVVPFRSVPARVA